MRYRSQAALWAVTGLAAGLFVVQTALADSDTLLARYAITLLAVGGAAWIVMRLTGIGFRAVNGPAPEPVVLALAALAALSLWAAAWWLMDLTNYRLDRWLGALALPTPITQFSDSLLGLDLTPVTYELEILLAVVLLPLAEGWLLWGLLQPALGAALGRWRAAWVMGLVAGTFWAVTAVQNAAPALPWGLASWGGYVVIGLVAAQAVYLTGSWWAGFAAYGAFAYASFRWRDDLFREFYGKDYLDPAWLTVIVLGLLGAVVALQAIRFRTPRPAEGDLCADPALRAWVIAGLVTGAAALVVLDVIARA